MKNIPFVIPLLIVSFISCTKKADSVKEPSVYVAGSFLSNGKFVPCYWKNGELIPLTDTAIAGRAFSIVISDNIVACAGDITMNGGIIAFSWKNGKLDTLNLHGEANDIAISDNDLYVAGYYRANDTVNKACYWKNGQQVGLPQNNIMGYATSISAFNGKIFIGGLEWQNSTNSLAEYWVNNELIQFNTPNAKSYDILVLNNDIYLAGAIQSATNSIAGYWKNGEWVQVSKPDVNSWAREIAISDGDIYISGQNGGECGYWKNGKWNGLGTNAYAYSIAVNGNDVYVSGNLLGNETGYWKNGEWKSLGKGFTQKILIQ